MCGKQTNWNTFFIYRSLDIGIIVNDNFILLFKFRGKIDKQRPTLLKYKNESYTFFNYTSC